MGRLLITLSVLLILGTLGKWIYDSSDYGKMLVYSMDSKDITTTESDPLMGTTISKTTNQPGSWLGLLDIGFPFGAIPMICVWLVLGFVGYKMQTKQVLKT